MSEPTLYVKIYDKSDVIIVSLYVDDLLVTGSNVKLVDVFKRQMRSMFEMTDLGMMSYFLGMEVHQTKDGIFISQKKYAEEILKKFKLQHCKPVATPLPINIKLSKDDGYDKVDERRYRSLIGSLLYLTATRPDLMFAASLLSRFMNVPSQAHYGVAKRVLRYIRGTNDYGIWFQAKECGDLVGYVDSDWAGSADDMKSTTGYVFHFGSGVFSWNSKKQSVVAQSTAEAEFIAASSCVNQAIWLRKILKDLGQDQEDATVINCDNKSTISMVKNPINHGRTKHMKIKFYFIRDAEKDKEVDFVYCSTENNVADLFTKPLSKARFEFLRSLLGMSSKSIKEENVGN